MLEPVLPATVAPRSAQLQGWGNRHAQGSPSRPDLRASHSVVPVAHICSTLPQRYLVFNLGCQKSRDHSLTNYSNHGGGSPPTTGPVGGPASPRPLLSDSSLTPQTCSNTLWGTVFPADPGAGTLSAGSLLQVPGPCPEQTLTSCLLNKETEKRPGLYSRVGHGLGKEMRLKPK